jgi:intraflagellar transport protein 140
LYIQCKRYDLLLHLYKISRQWDKAIKLCEKHCRIHLRTTYYSYGKYLESEKRIKEAIRMYELSETHRYEVPRMLVEDPHQLESYINTKKDNDLFQWWAQYQESGGEIEAALKYYELAKDWLSLVRLLCFCGDMEKAAAITEKVNDKASCYHLAKTLEDRGENIRAIHFLTKAEAFGNAIRICKENHLLDQLWTLAQLAQPSDQLDAARFFETKSDRPDFDKAIQLYHRAGYASKALDLAFS